MTLESALVIVIVALVTYAVTALIKLVSKRIGKDLTGVIVPVVSLVTALATVYGSALAANIPPDYHLLIVTLAGWLGSGGVHGLVKTGSPPTSTNIE